MIAFGPVPSRRLGRSLGINNIPPKVCSYACVYCQLGRTIKLQTERLAFYDPDRIVGAVAAKAKEAKAAGEPVDVLTFVPDGEPTLDLGLAREIEMLRPLGVKIAVITNASLIWDEGVRQALMGADWVSLKVDAASEPIWRRADRPHGRLQLGDILEGAQEFARHYKGELVTETMLVRGLNDDGAQLSRIADLLARLGPDTAYLAVPTRPPAEHWVRPPDEAVINRSYQIVSERVDRVELLIGYEGNAFASTGRAEDDLLDITAVHPMRQDAVQALLMKAGAGWSTVRKLVAEGQLVEADYGGRKFFLRNLGKHSVRPRK